MFSGPLVPRMFPQTAVAQNRPPTVADAGPAPSRPLIFPVEVVANIPGLNEVLSVAPGYRVIAPRPTVRLATLGIGPLNSVWPAVRAVFPMLWVMSMLGCRTRIRSPPDDVEAAAPQFGGRVRRVVQPQRPAGQGQAADQVAAVAAQSEGARAGLRQPAYELVVWPRVRGERPADGRRPGPADGDAAVAGCADDRARADVQRRGGGERTERRCWRSSDYPGRPGRRR